MIKRELIEAIDQEFSIKIHLNGIEETRINYSQQAS